MYSRKPVKTSDGSFTLFIEELNETYHSIHGALTESKHVFIKNGFSTITTEPIKILEVGFGTGLNALLTLLESIDKDLEVSYCALEPYPIGNELIEEVRYKDLIRDRSWHSAGAERHFEDKSIVEFYKSWFSGNTTFTKEKFKLELVFEKVQEFTADQKFDIIYYDAFAPRAQEEMWADEIFTKMNTLLHCKGILVTYCAKGSFKRSLKNAGFMVESLAGPPGKREMIRALKDC